jgi:repressor LexA
MQPPGDDDCDPALTERQQKILECVRQSVESRGYAPTLREIADAVGLRSTSAVDYQLKNLENMGQLTRDAGMPRTVVEKSSRRRVFKDRSAEAGGASVSADSQNMASVPLFERIAAGGPVIAHPFSDGFMHLPRSMVGSGDLFAVKVAGDSMVNASIFDGDYVVVRQQDDALDGDIVAALIEEDVTVKTFRRVNGHVWLTPGNPSYDPIPGDGCRLMGKVVCTLHLPDGLTPTAYSEQLDDLAERLQNIAVGPGGAGEFEMAVGDVIKLCFPRALGNVEARVRNSNGAVIRDWIASNRAQTGFWSMMRQRYDATQVIWECKNYTDLKADDFHQVAYYSTKAIGRLVIVAFRGHIQQSFYNHIQRVVSELNGMVIPVGIQDLQDFVRKSRDGKSIEDLIQDRYDQIVRKVSRLDRQATGTLNAPDLGQISAHLAGCG